MNLNDQPLLQFTPSKVIARFITLKAAEGGKSLSETTVSTIERHALTVEDSLKRNG